MSKSWAPLLLAPLVLLGATGTFRGIALVPVTGGLGGPGAIATTPPLLAAIPAIPPPTEPPPELFTEPAVDFGDSESFGPLTEPGVVAAGDV
jgi:hypothetical protein